MSINTRRLNERCKDQSLITRGIYRHMCHPCMPQCGFGAQALLVPNWLADFAGIFCFGLMYLRCVPRKEAMMLRQFGDEYATIWTPRQGHSLSDKQGGHLAVSISRVPNIFSALAAIYIPPARQYSAPASHARRRTH